MAIGGMYKVKNPMETAMQGMSQAAGTYGNMSKGSKTTVEPPGKTAGGAIGSMAGGAAAGTAVLPGWGTAIGAVVGGLAYALS